MKTSTIATVLSVLIGVGVHFAASAATKPAGDNSAQCSEIEKQLEELSKQAEAVCDKDDAESQKQCEAFDAKFEELEKAMDAAGCDGGDQDDNGDDNGGDEEMPVRR